MNFIHTGEEGGPGGGAGRQGVEGLQYDALPRQPLDRGARQRVNCGRSRDDGLGGKIHISKPKIIYNNEHKILDRDRGSTGEARRGREGRRYDGSKFAGSEPWLTTSSSQWSCEKKKKKQTNG